MEYTPDIKMHLPVIRGLASRTSFVLELGPNKGIGSTRAIVQGMKLNSKSDKLFITVDLKDKLLVEPKVDYWRQVVGDSTEESTFLKVKKICLDRKPGFIFVDTNHEYEHLKKELALWSRLAGDKTVWAFHDTYMFGVYNKMTDAIKEFARDNDWKFIDYSQRSHGLGIMKKS